MYSMNQGLSRGWNFKDPNYNGCGWEVCVCVCALAFTLENGFCVRSCRLHGDLLVSIYMYACAFCQVWSVKYVKIYIWSLGLGVCLITSATQCWNWLQTGETKSDLFTVNLSLSLSLCLVFLCLVHSNLFSLSSVTRVSVFRKNQMQLTLVLSLFPFFVVFLASRLH